MALTNDQITAQNFKDFYGQIRPYLNGSFPTPIVNCFAKSDMRSTDEKIIGQWTDGKPLYQKTLLYEGQTTANTETTLFTLGEDFDHIVSLEAIAGYMVGGSTTNLNYLSVPFDETNNCFVRVYASSQGKTIKMRTSGFSFGFKDIYVTVLYTKTTDSAIKVGTGTDYSTDEQIIGTWIDGKPVYQKTIDFGALPNSTDKSVNHNITNLGDIVDVKCFSRNSSTGSAIPIPYINAAATDATGFWLSGTAFHIYDQSNMSAYDKTYITILYTKTTD